MRRFFALLGFSLLLLGFQSSASAQDILVPAGTLLRCTLDEPNFSSATADIGDPVICHLSTLREFGQNVFPRGSYLGGHLEADKEPGHFVGKGYLQLVFDRIGFPTSDVPVPSKVIAAKGYKVDRHGDIIGKGHATRDIVEWLIPPLWPWKILTLPGRGPRPTLKGEEQITVRLMDDIQIPRQVASAQSYNRPTSYDHPRPVYRPQSADRPPAALQRSVEQAQAVNAQQNSAPQSKLSEVSYVAESTLPENQPDVSNASTSALPETLPSVPELSPAQPQRELTQSEATQPERIPPDPIAQRHLSATQADSSATSPTALPRSTRQPRRISWIALKSGNVDAVTNYRIHQGSVSYVLSTGARGSVDITEVDWRKTSQLNAAPIASSARGTSAAR
jgi:hypothetical protein